MSTFGANRNRNAPAPFAPAGSRPAEVNRFNVGGPQQPSSPPRTAGFGGGGAGGGFGGGPRGGFGFGVRRDERDYDANANANANDPRAAAQAQASTQNADAAARSRRFGGNTGYGDVAVRGPRRAGADARGLGNDAPATTTRTENNAGGPAPVFKLTGHDIPALSHAGSSGGGSRFRFGFGGARAPPSASNDGGGGSEAGGTSAAGADSPRTPRGFVGAFSSHWSPYDRVRVVNAVP
jgi:hypothetical protein